MKICEKLERYVGDYKSVSYDDSYIAHFKLDFHNLNRNELTFLLKIFEDFVYGSTDYFLGSSAGEK